MYYNGKSIVITSHYYERVKERTKVKTKEAALKLAESAFYKGASAETLAKRERQYMNQKEADGKIEVRLYQSYIFIFGKQGECITLYHAPEWFDKKVYYSGKERIRDIKKYSRCHIGDLDAYYEEHDRRGSYAY